MRTNKLFRGFALLLALAPGLAGAVDSVIVGVKSPLLTGDAPLPVKVVTGSVAPTPPTGASATQVQGPAADNDAAVGNPTLVGSIVRSAAQTYTAGDAATPYMTTNGIPGVHLVNSTGSNAVSVTSSGSDAASNSLVTMGVRAFTMVFNGTTHDRTRGDLNGLVTQPYAFAASNWSYAAASGGISNTTTAVTIKAAAGGALRNCITHVDIDAGTLGAATEVVIRDGAGGTVLWRGFAGTGGGFKAAGFSSPLCGTANTLLEVATLTATGTGGVYVNVSGFTR